MVRAAVDNRAMAQSVGINTSAALHGAPSPSAAASPAWAARSAPTSCRCSGAIPFEHLVYFLIVVAVGGLGSLRGPFIAALLIGIADTACKYWMPEFGAFLDLRRDDRRSCCGGRRACSGSRA